jgi:phosphoenolpyruvate carboxylase
MSPAASLIAQLDARLNELHARTAETPLFNPVFQVGLELSRRLETGDLTLDDLGGLIAELECDGLMARAGRLQRLLAPLDPSANDARIDALAQDEDFAAFAERWRHPYAHIVFTAHPTFLLSHAQAKAVAQAASEDEISQQTACLAPHDRDVITLDSEHDDAMAALARAQQARDRINARLFGEARRRFPRDWRKLSPLPFRFASWVGYDMDGRTDISWTTSLRYRLGEKAERLAAYAAMLETASPECAGALDRASKLAADMAERFAGDLSEPAALSAAANALTADHPDKLISLSGMITELEQEAARADDASAETMLVAAAAMRAGPPAPGTIRADPSRIARDSAAGAPSAGRKTVTSTPFTARVARWLAPSRSRASRATVAPSRSPSPAGSTSSGGAPGSNAIAAPRAGSSPACAVPFGSSGSNPSWSRSADSVGPRSAAMGKASAVRESGPTCSCAARSTGTTTAAGASGGRKRSGGGGGGREQRAHPARTRSAAAVAAP